MENNKIITKCRIEKDRFENKVIGVDESGVEHLLFTYYPDEIRFTADEFVGHSIQYANDLFIKRDMAYLRS